MAGEKEKKTKEEQTTPLRTEFARNAQAASQGRMAAQKEKREANGKPGLLGSAQQFAQASQNLNAITQGKAGIQVGDDSEVQEKANAEAKLAELAESIESRFDKLIQNNKGGKIPKAQIVTTFTEILQEMCKEKVITAEDMTQEVNSKGTINNAQKGNNQLPPLEEKINQLLGGKDYLEAPDVNSLKNKLKDMFAEICDTLGAKGLASRLRADTIEATQKTKEQLAGLMINVAETVHKETIPEKLEKGAKKVEQSINQLLSKIPGSLQGEARAIGGTIPAKSVAAQVQANIERQRQKPKSNARG